jgi:VCBS repeat-containing protein
MLLSLLPTTALASGYKLSVETAGSKSFAEYGMQVSANSIDIPTEKQTIYIDLSFADGTKVTAEKLAEVFDRIEVNGVKSFEIIALTSNQSVPVAGATISISIRNGALRVNLGRNSVLNVNDNITVTFYPNESGGEEYNATISSDIENGTATQIKKTNDTYILTGTPDDGYMLDYWEYSTDRGNSWCDEADRIVNDVENSAATTTVTLTEDRVYRAVFKPAQFILLDDEIGIRQYHWLKPPANNPFQEYGYFIICDPIAKSELVREGLDVELNLRFGVPSILKCYSTTVELYKNNDTVQPFWTRSWKQAEGYHPLDNGRIQVRMLVENIPFMESITVKVTIKDSNGENETTSIKHYQFPQGAGIEQDMAGAARFDALDDLASYYENSFAEKIFEEENTQTSHSVTEPVADSDGSYTTYDSFSAVRYLLRYAYEDAYAEIKDVAVTAEDVTAAYDDVIALFSQYVDLNAQIKAGNGDYYKNIDGVIKVLYYVNVEPDMPPTYAYVPAGAVVRDAMEAAFESNNPRGWIIEGGQFVTAFGPDDGDGRVVAGGTSSQIVYCQNHAYALGVGSQTMTDRDILVFGVTIDRDKYPTLNNIPNKDDLIWAMGVLAEKCDLPGLESNEAYAHAKAIARLWSVNTLGTDGASGYPTNLAAAQQVVDDALAALKAAYPEVDFTRYNYPEAVLNVMNLIRAIGTVTLDSETAIREARAAYAALENDAQRDAVNNYAVLVSAEETLAALKAAAENPTEYSEALKGVLNYLEANVTSPAVGSEAGEWAVLSLARGDRVDKNSDWAKKYLANLDAALTAGNVITSATEYERVTLALTSLGLDASAYGTNNTDLTAAFSSYKDSMGVNAKVFALLALNSKPYNGDASAYVDGILAEELESGGWDYSGIAADVDMTAMAIQALAPYYNSREDVKTAVNKALAILKIKQDEETGGFIGMNGALSTCSTAQVVTALTALGINPASEEWAVTGDKTPMTALVTFYNETYGYFGETTTAQNQMSTEQAAYALVAYDRYLYDQNSLYAMSDAFRASSDNRVTSVTVAAIPATASGDTFTVELPFGADPAALLPADVAISLRSKKANVTAGPATADSGATWTFTVTAEDGTTADYTIQMTVAPNPAAENIAAVAAAKTAIEGINKTLLMETANDSEGIKNWIEAEIAKLDLNGVNTAVTVNTVTPALTGTAADKDGTAGSFTCTVNLSKGEGVTHAADSAEITGAIAPTHYISTDAGINSVSVSGKAGHISGNTIGVTLDYAEGATLPTDPAEVNITTKDPDATVRALATADNGATWTFTVTAQDGATTENYTINVQIAADPGEGAKADLAAMKTAIENKTYAVPMTTANSAEEIKTWLESEIAKLNTSNVSITVALEGVTPAAAGTADNINGTNGSFTFTVSLSKSYDNNGQTAYATATAVASGTVTATTYVKSGNKNVGSITVKDVTAAAVTTYAYTVTIPYQDTAPVAGDFNVTLEDSKTRHSAPGTADGSTWSFTVTAEDGTTANYTIQVTIAPNPAAENIAAVAAAKQAVEEMTNTVPMATANTAAEIKAWLETEIGKLSLNGVTAEVSIDSLTPATAGTAADKDGTDGGFTYTVDLSKGQDETYASGSVQVSGVITAAPYKEEITVSFRLIGATISDGEIDLENGDYKGSEYVTWIKTTTYTLREGDKVYDLFTKALDEAGLQSVGADGNYVKTIYAPSLLDGCPLTEKVNGDFSGWMYTVNGSHPNVGLQYYELQNGDQVVWHYVNDFRYEVHDWFSGSLGDSSTWSKWLQAADINPGEEEPEPDKPVLTPEVNATDGTAAVELTEADMEGAIEAVKQDGGDITVRPQISGEADKVTVELPKTSLSSMATDTEAGLRVETNVGNVTIPHEVLASIAEQAEGDTVTVGLESVDKEKTLTDEQKKAVGDKPVFDITINSGDKQISDFSGGQITISLPYTLKEGETADEVNVWYLNNAGELEEITCTYDAETGLATFTTDHLSYYIVGIDKAENEDAAAAKKVDDLIAKISDPVTLSDKEAIEKARAAYNALTEGRKKLVTKHDQLQAAEAAYAALIAEQENTEAARNVDDLIAKISDPVTLSEKTAIEEARAAYNALTEEQKNLVTKLEQLKAAEAKLAELQGANKPAYSPEDEQGKPSADGKQTGTGSATGDYSYALNIALFLLLALCACGYLYRRRGKEESNL